MSDVIDRADEERADEDRPHDEERVKRGQAKLAEIRKLMAEDEARNKAFAETIRSPKRKYIHRRDPAAEMVANAINAPYSGELLRRSDCPYIVVSRIALYAEADLRALAESILDNALPRSGTPDKRRNQFPRKSASHQ